jgi:hypothetical protein
MSAFDKLSKVAKPKSKSNVIECSDQTMEQVCDSYIISSRELKDAEAANNRDKSSVIDYMRNVFAKSMKEGDAVKSFRLNSKLLCIFTDRFKAPCEHDMEELLKSVSQAQVNKFFKQKASVKIKESVSTNEAKLTELLELLGDKADQFFDIGVSYTTADDLDKIIVSEGCYEEVQEVIERLRYSPTVRVS